MKLTTLLTQITPLPWTFDGANVISSDDSCIMINTRSGGDKDYVHQASLSIQYAMHAANVLPELVKALERIITSIPDSDITNHRARIAEINGIARDALTRANEIKL